MNKLFQQLNQSRSLPSNIRQMVQTFKAMRNPQQMANGNPEQAFKNMCKQMNVNPDEIMNMLK